MHGRMFSSDSTTTNLPPRWAIKTSPTCSVSERRFDNASSSFCTCGKFQAWNSGIPGLAGDRNNTNLSMRPYPSNNKVLDGMEKRRKMNRRLFPGLLMTNKWGLYSQHNMICIRWYHLLALPFTFTCRTCAGFWSRSSWWSWSLSTKDTQRPNPTRHPHVSSQFLIFGTDLRIQDLHSDPLKSSFSQCFFVMSSSLEGIHGEKMTRFDRICRLFSNKSRRWWIKGCSRGFLHWAKHWPESYHFHPCRWAHYISVRPGLPCPVPPPQHGLGHHPSPPSNIVSKSHKGEFVPRSNESNHCRFTAMYFLQIFFFFACWS